MALMPKQTKAAVKLIGGLTLQKLAGLFATLMASIAFSKIVHAYLQIPFMLVCVLLFLFVTKKTKNNPRKTFGASLIDYFFYIIYRRKYNTITGVEYRRTKDKEAEELAIKDSRKQAKIDKEDEFQRGNRVKKIGKLRTSRKSELERKRKKYIKRFTTLKQKRKLKLEKQFQKAAKKDEKKYQYICKELSKKRYSQKMQEAKNLKAKIR